MHDRLPGTAEQPFDLIARAIEQKRHAEADDKRAEDPHQLGKEPPDFDDVVEGLVYRDDRHREQKQGEPLGDAFKAFHTPPLFLADWVCPVTPTVYQFHPVNTREEFMKRYEDTVGKSVDLLAQEMEIDPEYASLVVPTMVVCRNFIDIFNAESLWAPGVSLLDGIAYDFAEKKKFLKSVHNFENDILVTSKNIAKRYSSSKSHIQGTMNLCLNIFDSMKKVHGMGARERLLLQIAALLHDCGKYISMEKVSECSYQIIMSTDIIGLSFMERQMIACAVRFNNSAFVYYDELYSMGIAIDRESYIKVAKMTAILRLANAMDRSHYQKVKGIKAVLKDRELQMIVDSAQDISLELGLLKDKEAFFEEVFGIRLVLRRKGRA